MAEVMEENPPDREGNDFRPHAMMVVIGLRAANYIKLVGRLFFIQLISEE
jgi:hypothetical protein